MSKDFFKISCINPLDNCNYIKPEKISAFDGINPNTNQPYTNKEKKYNKNLYKKICNVKGGKMSVCCSNLDDYPESQDIINKVKRKYPKIKLRMNNGKLDSVLLSKTQKKGAGWVDISPYIICKISKANIKQTKFNDIDIAINLVEDCFINSCNTAEPELTLKKILNKEKEPINFRYLDDMKVEESIREYNIDYVKSCDEK